MDLNRKTIVIITNPAHEYATWFLKQVNAIGDFDVVSLFTLEWRYEKFQKYYSYMKQSFSHEILAFRMSDEQVVNKVSEFLGSKRNEVYAIIPWDDSSGSLAGNFSDKFNLGWNQKKVTDLFRDKSLMRKHLKENSVNASVEYKVTDKVEECLEFQKKINTWPVVLKPTSSGSSSQVYYAYNFNEIQAYFFDILNSENSFDEIRNDTVQIEEYLDGIEYAVNGLTDNQGNVLITDVFKYHHSPTKDFNLFISKAEYLQPGSTVVRELSDATYEILKGSNLKNSPFHGEMRMTNSGPKLIEIQSRFPGHLASLSQRTIFPNLVEFATLGYLKQLEFSKPLEIFKPSSTVYATSVSGNSSREGILKKINGKNEIEKIESFVAYSFLPKVGEKIEITKNEDHLLYVVLMANKDEEVLLNDIKKARELLSFELK